MYDGNELHMKWFAISNPYSISLYHSRDFIFLLQNSVCTRVQDIIPFSTPLYLFMYKLLVAHVASAWIILNFHELSEDKKKETTIENFMN